MENLKQKSNPLCISACFVLFVLAACGGSGGSTSVDSGLDESRVVGELSADELNNACIALGRQSYDALIDGFRDVDTLCEFASAIATESPEECRSFAGECRKTVSQSDVDEQIDAFEQSGDFVAEDEFACEGDDFGEAGSCGATVAELEGCFQELLDALVKVFDGLSCENAGNEEVFENFADDFTDFSQFPACEVVNDKCSGAFEEETSVTPALSIPAVKRFAAHKMTVQTR